MENLEFHPTVREVKMAEKTFLKEIDRNKEYICLPEGSSLHMSKEIALSCALSAVWREARKYQYKQTNEYIVD